MSDLVVMSCVFYAIALLAFKKRILYPSAENRHFLITDIARDFLKKGVSSEQMKVVILDPTPESKYSLNYIDPFSDPVISIFKADDIILSKILTSLNLDNLYRLITGIGKSMLTSDRDIR